MTARGAVLDACVLVNAAVRDTLLRLVQKGIYTPYWSDEIISGLIRTLERKMFKTSSQTAQLVEQLRLHFDECFGQ